MKAGSNRFHFIFLFLLFSSSCFSQSDKRKAATGTKNEVIYHIFLRSFYDSDGDGNGDLKGLQSKLDYLQDLGINSILLTPLYSSLYYHNYFSDDFEKIDPEFGTLQDYLSLVKDVHKRNMKIYLDMETQYVTEDHVWWKDSYGNPGSKYSDYILYNDSAHTKPEPIIFNLTELPGYDGTIRKVATVNLHSKNVLDYNYNLFKYFVDPNHDKKFDDGVDGFRLDHAMDDLDWKGRLPDLFENFWKPLLTKLKAVNPKLRIVAEQANWMDWGKDYFEKANVDRVFAFRIQKAFTTFDKKQLEQQIDSTFSQTSAGHQQVVFIENHDLDRFASLVKKDPAKEKVGAAFNLLTGGIPSIYYGQELGMYGVGGYGKFGMTDANDIPRREAFEWYQTDEGKGMAIWYKNPGRLWWDSTNLKPNDGISLEEEKNDPNSLYQFYKKLLRLRQSNPALYAGNYQTISNNNETVFSFLRAAKDQRLLIVINLSSKPQQTNIDDKGILPTNKLSSLLVNNKTQSVGKRISLIPYEVQIWKIN